MKLYWLKWIWFFHLKLLPHGYDNIDAIDGSPDMLKLAQNEKLYKTFYVSLLGGEHKAPIEDGTWFIHLSSLLIHSNFHR